VCVRDRANNLESRRAERATLARRVVWTRGHCDKVHMRDENKISSQRQAVRVFERFMVPDVQTLVARVSCCFAPPSGENNNNNARRRRGSLGFYLSVLGVPSAVYCNLFCSSIEQAPDRRRMLPQVFGIWLIPKLNRPGVPIKERREYIFII
jgi:hypothetical protein